MTDTSLSNNQPVSPANSYVDSYAPPVQSVPAAPAVSPAVPQPPKATDPLAELEKALQEYETKQKQLQTETKDVVQKTQAVVADTAKEDPLAELERVLNEYDAKYQQKQGDQTAQPASVPAPNQSPAKTHDPDNTMTMDEFKHMLRNPNPPKNAIPKKTADTAKTQTPQPLREKQAIEEQNIFELLGVMDAQTDEKEAFLDELQQALWEDFLDKDVALLVNADQLKEIQALRSKTDLPETTRQEQLIQKVEQLVPDVEEIMLEKALELKEDMVKERLAGMKEYYATRPAELAKIQEAEQHILAGRWKTGSQLLNTLTA